jgi:hypothetical protein
MSCAVGKNDFASVDFSLVVIFSGRANLPLAHSKDENQRGEGIIMVFEISVTHLFTLTWRREWDSITAVTCKCR